MGGSDYSNLAPRGASCEPETHYETRPQTYECKTDCRPVKCETKCEPEPCHEQKVVAAPAAGCSTGFGFGWGFFSVFIVIFLITLLIIWVMAPVQFLKDSENSDDTKELDWTRVFITALVVSLIISLIIIALNCWNESLCYSC